jgi:hypothetical protein
VRECRSAGKKQIMVARDQRQTWPGVTRPPSPPARPRLPPQTRDSQGWPILWAKFRPLTGALGRTAGPACKPWASAVTLRSRRMEGGPGEAQPALVRRPVLTLAADDAARARARPSPVDAVARVARLHGRTAAPCAPVDAVSRVPPRRSPVVACRWLPLTDRWPLVIALPAQEIRAG